MKGILLGISHKKGSRGKISLPRFLCRLGIGIKMRLAKGTEHNIFRRFIRVDQLNGTGLIALHFQTTQTQGIGGGITQLLTKHGILRDKGKGGTADAVIELMMTAGSREDHIGLPCRRAAEHKVGGNVAGMERDYQLWLFLGRVFRNISAEKFQSVKAKLFGAFTLASNLMLDSGRR